MKFTIKDFFSKCDQIRSFLQNFLQLFLQLQLFSQKVYMIDFRMGSKHVSNYVLDPIAWGAHITLIGFLNDLLQPSPRREGGSFPLPVQFWRVILQISKSSLIYI